MTGYYESDKIRTFEENRACFKGSPRRSQTRKEMKKLTKRVFGLMRTRRLFHNEKDNKTRTDKNGDKVGKKKEVTFDLRRVGGHIADSVSRLL